MYSLASYIDENKAIKDNIIWMADYARKRLPDTSYAARMFDYVKKILILRTPAHSRQQIGENPGVNPPT